MNFKSVIVGWIVGTSIYAINFFFFDMLNKYNNPIIFTFLFLVYVFINGAFFNYFNSLESSNSEIKYLEKEVLALRLRLKKYEDF